MADGSIGVEAGARERSCESACVGRAQEGDCDAFRQIFEDNVDAVARYASSRVGPKHRDDVVAETFLRAWASIGSYQSRGTPLAAWLLRIARNISFDLLRREGQRAARESLGSLGVAYHEDDDPVVTDDSRRIWGVLAEMSPRQRTVLELRFVEQLPVAEVARLMDLSDEGVRALTARARQSAAAMARQRGLGENAAPMRQSRMTAGGAE